MSLSGGAGRPLLIRECCHFGIWLLTKLAASLNWSKFEANSIGPQLVISEETPHDYTIKLKRGNIFLPFTGCLLWFRKGSGLVLELGSSLRSCACSKPGKKMVVDDGQLGMVVVISIGDYFFGGRSDQRLCVIMIATLGYSGNDGFD